MPTVVVGYVPKPEGEAALDRAIEEAQLRGAELIVVHSHRSRNGGGGSEGGDAEPIPELEAARARLDEAGVSYDVRQLERGFEAAEDLVSVAETHDADLIVIGLRRRTPGRQAHLGLERAAGAARRPLPGARGQGRVAGRRPASDR